MAGDAVRISWETLDELYGSLTSIHDELHDATDRSEKLEGIIGDPFGRDELRKAVQHFEEDWDDKRKRLLGDVDTVREHTKALLDGWKKWDEDAANTLESQTA